MRVQMIVLFKIINTYFTLDWFKLEFIDSWPIYFGKFFVSITMNSGVEFLARMYLLL